MKMRTLDGKFVYLCGHPPFLPSPTPGNHHPEHRSVHIFILVVFNFIELYIVFWTFSHLM